VFWFDGGGEVFWSMKPADVRVLKAEANCSRKRRYADGPPPGLSVTPCCMEKPPLPSAPPFAPSRAEKVSPACATATTRVELFSGSVAAPLVASRHWIWP